jgi:hypothetical protein
MYTLYPLRLCLKICYKGYKVFKVYKVFKDLIDLKDLKYLINLKDLIALKYLTGFKTLSGGGLPLRRLPNVKTKPYLILELIIPAGIVTVFSF